MSALADRIMLLHGWRAAVVAVLAGAVAALSLAPLHIVPALFVAFPLLVWLLDGALPPADDGVPRHALRRALRAARPAFVTGWCFGFGYHVAGLWWIGSAFLVEAETFAWLMPFAVLVLPAGLALFTAAACAVARIGWREAGPDSSWRIVVLAAALTLFEWLRGTVLTGFPWNVFGYGVMPVPLAMQSAALVGLYGMTFAALLAASLPALAARARGGRLAVGGIAALTSAHLGYGAWVLSGADGATVPGVRLRIVQPAIPQTEKWRGDNEDEIIDAYLDGTNANTGPATASASAFTHIVWPESAFPFILAQRPDRIAQIAAILPGTTTLLTGGMRMEGEGEDRRIYNSILALDGTGALVASADKTRLVPFGEYIPFAEQAARIGLRQLVSGLGFAAGSQRQLMDVAGAPPLLPLICYEVAFSGTLVPADAGRPGWILNVTNDAWFGMTSGPYQHAHAARLRAVEEGLPLVRAANTGISMIVDPYARIAASLPLGARGVLDGALPAAAPRTFFARNGNGPALLFVCIALMLSLVMVRAGHRRL